MRARVVAIVEGHGETTAFPALIRKVFGERYPQITLELPTPIRVSRSKFVANAREQERSLQLAAQKAGKDGFVLVLLDADEDCPATLGPQLKQAAIALRSDLVVSVVLAKSEFESWFLAAAASLEICTFQEAPTDPESIQGAKEWIRAKRGRYSPTVDQASFASRLPLEEAERAPSFRKLLREVEQIAITVNERNLGEAG